jgi:thiol-disulfide isomerase/thioredoxin
MRFYMTRIIRVAVLLLCISAAAKAQGITFEQGSFASVVAKAKTENKLIFIDFYTSWCGPCKHMAETVFKQDNVGQFFNSRFISYKVDAEKGEGKALAEKFNVHIYPTYLFIDSKGAVFNRSIGSCKDSVFLGIAATARQEFVNPYSMPRLKAQYATQKKDTAFLRLYIDKLVANHTHAFEAVEQYLSVQTAMRSGSSEMMAFIIKYPRELYYGGRAAQALGKYSAGFRQVADSLQREQLEFANDMLFSNTRIYAMEAKSETLLKRYIAAVDSIPASRRSSYVVEGIWLDFYSATGNWAKFGPLANHWLDSICAQLKPETRRGAFIVADNAKKYRDHFSDEKEVVKKALRWVKAVLQVNPDYSPVLSFYANLLYEDSDTANAILVKTKALNSLPPGSLHRNIVQTNLEHMQKGEPLEEE